MVTPASKHASSASTEYKKGLMSTWCCQWRGVGRCKIGQLATVHRDGLFDQLPSDAGDNLFAPGME